MRKDLFMEENANASLHIKPEPAFNANGMGVVPSPDDQPGSQSVLVDTATTLPASMLSSGTGTLDSSKDKASSFLPCTNGDKEVMSSENCNDEEPIDSESVKGIFGWETVDDTSIPYILRKKRKFVSVRIVERKLLSKYPNTFPDELGKKDPLVSHFITEAEASLLNEINTAHCDYEYGHNPFTVKDLIVDLEEFGEFFKIVKKTFPADVLAKMNEESAGPVMSPSVKSDLSQYCGWMQINNTVSPYIMRLEGGEQLKLVPLSVIVYAAGLLTNTSIAGLLPTLQECAMLNKACKAAGFDFTFGKNTRLISVTEVVQRCQVQLFDLPFKNPLQHARYLDPRSGQPSSNLLRSQMSQPHVIGGLSPSVQHSSNQQQSLQGVDSMARAVTNTNPFMEQRYPHPSFAPTQTGVPGFGSQSHMTMRSPVSHMGLGMEMQRIPGVQSHVMSDKLQNMDNRALGMSGSFWPMMARGPPPAHIGSTGSSSIMSKTPPMVPEPPVSSIYQPSVLPQNQLLHPKNTSTLPDLSHPIFRGSVPGSQRHMAEQLPQKDSSVSNIRYPPPRIGLPQPPSHFPVQPSLPFGVNQFNSSLFARTDLTDKRQHQTDGTYPLPLHPPHQRRWSRESLQDSTTRSLSTSSLPPNSSNPSDRPMFNNGGRTQKPQSVPSSSNGNSKPSHLSEKISACLVNGKSISCLSMASAQRSGNFCLVEAVSKLYFPNVPLAEFVKVLQMVLQVQLYECSEEEEAAFVQYYNLPVKKLKCNKIIQVEDLEKFFPQLNYMFTKCATDSAVARPAMVQDSFAPPALITSQKRSSTSPRLGPPAKQVQVVPKLESVVQKLHQGRDFSVAPGEGGPPQRDASGSASVIVIDD